jgi:hypothetical protein
MRLLYLYPEPWTGRREQEAQALSTCVALAQSGVEVTFVTAGSRREWRQELKEIAGRTEEPGLRLITLVSGVGPWRSATIFFSHFKIWLSREASFDAGYVIHLQAGAMLRSFELPYLYEAHEVRAETPQKSPERHDRLHELEKQVLAGASWRVATSKALATALRAHYVLPDDFELVPNAGFPPVPHSLAAADGPFVCCGLDADGLDLIIAAAREERVPLKIFGGPMAEGRRAVGRLETRSVPWPPPGELPQALAGARAGIFFIDPTRPSGRYACPLELFDYARCGLPVIISALPSLPSLDVGSWCTQVEKSTKEAWAEAMGQYRYRPVQGETARAWAGVHTWSQRAQVLTRVLAQRPKGGRGR